MCLAIYKPSNITIPDDHLTQGFVRNSDGAGFAYIKGKKIVVSKGHMTSKEFMAAYKDAVAKYKNSPFLIHFRIRSLGERGQDNTHPFEFQHGVLIHNGTITGTGAEYNKGDSDTKRFAEMFGEHMGYDKLSKMKDDFGKCISGSRLVLMYPDKKFLIINEHLGEWEGGAWYSNQSYRPPRTYTPVGACNVH